MSITQSFCLFVTNKWIYASVFGIENMLDIASFMTFTRVFSIFTWDHDYQTLFRNNFWVKLDKISKYRNEQKRWKNCHYCKRVNSWITNGKWKRQKNVNFHKNFARYCWNACSGAVFHPFLSSSLKTVCDAFVRTWYIKLQKK